MNYESKKVDHLYIRKVDYSGYVDQNLVIAGITISRSDLNTRKKASFLTQASQSVYQEMDDLGFTLESYTHAKTLTRVTLDLVETKPNLKDLIEGLNTASNEMLAHSLGVSMVSVMLGQSCGWAQAGTLEKLALGGLLHDIGMKDFTKELISKPIGEMSFEERRQFEEHPAIGVELVRAVGVVPDDVLSIIHEHHENGLGQGFPRRLKSIRIHPMARVVGLADLFCDLTIKSPSGRRMRPIEEAFMYLEQTYSQAYSKDLITALGQTLGFYKAKKIA